MDEDNGRHNNPMHEMGDPQTYPSAPDYVYLILDPVAQMYAAYTDTDKWTWCSGINNALLWEHAYEAESVRTNHYPDRLSAFVARVPTSQVMESRRG